MLLETVDHFQNGQDITSILYSINSCINTGGTWLQVVFKSCYLHVMRSNHKRNKSMLTIGKIDLAGGQVRALPLCLVESAHPELLGFQALQNVADVVFAPGLQDKFDLDHL